MSRKPYLLLGGLAAVLSTACISILGKFEVGACPAGQELQGDVCVTPGPGVDVPTATSCSDPKAPACDEKRVCSDTTGLAVCVCKPEFTGGDCGPCGPGLQDNNGDGTCEKTCANAAPTCGAFAACTDATGTPKCGCTFGYGDDGAGNCVFNGGPLDPDFLQPDSAPWQVTKGTIEGADAGDGGADAEVGLARLSACSEWGTLRQVFDMPAAKDAQPVALKMKVRAACPNDGSCYNPASFTTSLGSTIFNVNPNTWTNLSLCLGQRGYGKGVDLRLYGFAQAYGYGYCNGSPGAGQAGREIQFDSVAFAADPGCPTASTVTNGDFETVGGWTVAGTGSVEPSIGNNSSKAGRLQNQTRCNETYAALTGTASYPGADVPGAALRFTYKGTNGKPMAIDMGDYPAPAYYVTGTGTYQDVRLCVPEGVKGQVGQIKFRHYAPVSGPCADPDVRESVIDDVGFVSAPDVCAPTVYVDDGGFERDKPTAWLYSSSSSGSAYLYNGTGHTGTRAGYIYTAAVAYSSGTISTTITVPPPAGAAGPAIKFFYKVTAATNGTYTASVSGSVPGSPYVNASTTLGGVAAWTEGKICIPSNAAGRMMNLSFYAQGPGTVTSYGQLFVDDVTADTDAACPVTP